MVDKSHRDPKTKLLNFDWVMERVESYVTSSSGFASGTWASSACGWGRAKLNSFSRPRCLVLGAWVLVLRAVDAPCTWPEARRTRHPLLYGGCSSKVEHRTVAPDVAGSSPVIHPNFHNHLNI